jgi:hypothetical protein
MDKNALGFGSDLLVAISAKPQAEQCFVEDFAIEPRSTMARRCIARCSSTLLTGPKIFPCNQSLSVTVRVETDHEPNRQVSLVFFFS